MLGCEKFFTWSKTPPRIRWVESQEARGGDACNDDGVVELVTDEGDALPRSAKVDGEVDGVTVRPSVNAVALSTCISAPGASALDCGIRSMVIREGSSTSRSPA
jgi:hypothetical protein